MDEINTLFDSLLKTLQDEAAQSQSPRDAAQAALMAVALRLVQVVVSDLHRASDALEQIARNTAPSDTGL